MLALSLKSRLSSLTQTLTSIIQSQSVHFQPPSPLSVLSSPYSSKRKLNEDDDDVVSLINRDPDSPPRLFVVQPNLRPDSFLQAKLNEALCLANSLEEQRDGYFQLDFFDKALPPHIIVKNPIRRSARPRAALYFGPGVVEDVKCYLNANDDDSKGAVDAVFVNCVLTAIQQRNLERIWGKPVFDRVGLIIAIFNAHAHTREAKLQAELASLMYKRSRLVRVRGPDGRLTFGEFGEAEVVSARGRGSGGRGFMSGAGETELQLQRRRILEQRKLLLSQIEDVRRTRALQRAARKKDGGAHNQRLATVAIVGYTNAGKSTLVSALSNSDLYSDSRLFATLDPRLRNVILPSGRKVLLSDTVGFISDLPLQLVQAFQATLEKVVEADLLVHVVDSTAPNLEEHRTTVLQVLDQIGVSEEKLQNMIEVWNKIDYQEEDDGSAAYDGEDGEDSSLSGDEEDDMTSGKNDAILVGEDGKGDFEEILSIEQGDVSDGWLLSGDEEGMGDLWLDTLANPQSEAGNDLAMNKELPAPQGPHVRTSAITGVGLQELLELIDEKLKTQDKQLGSGNVVGRGFFDRKWRPPRADDSGAAVE